MAHVFETVELNLADVIAQMDIMSNNGYIAIDLDDIHAKERRADNDAGDIDDINDEDRRANERRADNDARDE